jgi:hypothetical protein
MWGIKDANSNVSAVRQGISHQAIQQRCLLLTGMPQESRDHNLQGV